MFLPDICNHDTPRQVLNYPSMMTLDEIRLLYWLAEKYYQGDGVIVDVGIFLGASTNAFATGLKNSKTRPGRFARPICSYDIAIWVQSMDRYLEKENFRQALGDDALSHNSSFEPILRRLLQRHDAVVDLIIGDIVETAATDHPVEIAFYDCLKTNQRDFAVFRAFVPHFIPGRTIVLQQDYFHESAAYNKIRQEYFSDHFDYLGQVSTTGVFLCKSTIPSDKISTDVVTALPLSQKLDLLSSAAERASDNKTRVLTHLSIVEFLIDQQQPTLAAEKLAEIERQIAQHPLDEITRRPENIASGLRRRLGREI